MDSRLRGNDGYVPIAEVRIIFNIDRQQIPFNILVRSPAQTLIQIITGSNSNLHYPSIRIPVFLNRFTDPE